MNILSLINSSGYMSINREMARELGLDTAIIFADLVRQHMECEKYGSFECFNGKDNWFFSKVDDMQIWTTLGEKEQYKSLKNLRESGLIDQTVKGLPGKRYFHLNMEKILEFFGFQNNFTVPPKGRKPRENDFKKENVEPPFGRNYALPKGASLPYIEEKKDKKKNTNTPTPPPISVPLKVESGTNAPIGACVPVSFPSSSSTKQNAPRTFGQMVEEEVSVTDELEVKFHYGSDPVRNEMVVEEKVTVKEKVVKASDAEKHSYGPDGLVKLTEKQYGDLLKKMSEKERESWIEEVSNEIGAKGESKFNKEYSSHYHVILKWKAYRDKKNPMVDKDGKDWSKIAPHRRGSKLVTSGDFDDYAGFQGRMM